MMEARVQAATVACVVLTFLALATGDIFKCVKLREVFPNCSCSAALVDGKETIKPVVDCSGLQLVAVPEPVENYSDVIWELRLNNNSITSLNDNAFHGLKIRSLDLSGNTVSNISDIAFIGLTDTARALVLDADGLSVPPITAFQYLSGLETLTIRKIAFQHLNPTHQFFLPFIHLTDLTIDSSEITAIDSGSFTGPTQLQILSLTNLKLKNLPLDALADVHLRHLKKLTISGTEIETVSPHAFINLTVIEELDLSKNFIKTLDSNCFFRIGQTLKKLNLSANHLSDNSFTAPTALRDLMVLTDLDLSHNEGITSIPDLSNLNTVQFLRLQIKGNHITTLNEGEFVGIENKLNELDISENRINTIHDFAFKDVRELQVLRMTYQGSNSPVVIPSSLADAAGSMKELYLNNFPVNEDSLWLVVQQLHQLRVLNVASAELMHIPDLVFRNLTKLVELDLAFNQFTQVTQETFVGPARSLKRLYLSGNQLFTLPACLLDQYTNELEITLRYNPLICNCNLGWMIEAFQQNKITFPSPEEEPTCPDNTPLLSKDAASLPCSGGQTEVQCFNYYTTTTTQSPPTTVHPQLNIVLDQIETTKISVSWSVSDDTSLQYFDIEVKDPSETLVFQRNDINKAIRFISIPVLKAGTYYTICITPVYSNKVVRPECLLTRTLANDSNTAAESQSGSDDVAIIVGAVVGAVVLLVIIGAIAYLAFVRRRPKKDMSPARHVQPRVFAKSELPTMGSDSRSFNKPRIPSDSMQVVAISDGQTSNGRVGRAHILTSEGSYQVMSPPKGQQSTYSNDHGSLPPTPTDKSSATMTNSPGYYNEAFKRDDKYDEIEIGQREIVL